MKLKFAFCLLILATVKCYANAKTGPCTDELSWSTGTLLPVCDDNGDYEPKQCDASVGECSCVDLCGAEVDGTRGSTDAVRCRPDVPPCEKAAKLGRAGTLIGGLLRPRCRSDGFYYHTQCTAGSCYCVDRCGNEVPDTRHPQTRIRERRCACTDDSHAYNCPVNPCQDAVCRDFPQATCKPSICGGCIPEFTADGNIVDCGLPVCVDEDGTSHDVGTSWNVNACLTCECLEGGVPACLGPICAGPPRDDCVEDKQEGVCCSDWICPDAPVVTEAPVTPPIVGACTYPCPRIFRPVCGSDGNTYSNECEMGRAACQQDIDITVAVFRACDACTYPCLRIYSPVCASDGKTYANECEMGRTACQQDTDITVVSDGECEAPPSACTYPCPRIYQPVCGSNGNTYVNECEMGRAACKQNIVINVAQQGECDRTPIGPPIPNVRACEFNCTPEYQPVCGSDGDTYLNECEMRRVGCEQNVHIVVESEGRCQSECNITCSSAYEPVCGSDGQTYPNECSMREEACETKRDIMLDYNGECETGLPLFIPVRECNDICPEYYEPICGSDGDTYSNECKLKASACEKNIDITLAYQGPCNTTTTTTEAAPVTGVCPPADEGAVGICAEVCQDDTTCGTGEKCCPTECGGTFCAVPIVPVVTECFDKSGNMIGEGESFRPENSCVDCLCLNGRPTCPIVDCFENPGVGCVPKWEDGACCPTYDCPTPTDLDGCTDRRGDPRQDGESWDVPCGKCYCRNGKIDCPLVKCQAAPSPECFDDPAIQVPDACCPTYTCPSAGCFDREGKEMQEGDRWRMPCGECRCENGNSICPVRACELPPSPDCVAKEDPDLCCPSYTCPKVVEPEPVDVCAQIASSPISLSSTTPTTITYQSPSNVQAGDRIDCLWQVTAPVGQRVYGVVNSLQLDDGRLYFGPDPEADVYTGPGVAIYSRVPNNLDVVSNSGTGGNTIWFGYVANVPHIDNSFEVTLTATSDTDIQTCPGIYVIHVLPDSRVCDGNVDCPDGADELEMCPCPQGFVGCNDPSSNPCSRASVTSICPAYNADDIVCLQNTCGQCSAQLHDVSGRRITDAECQGLEPEPVDVCAQIASSPISVSSTTPTSITYQPPSNLQAGDRIDCLWQVTAPVGQRVYGVVNSWESDDGRLYFGPDPGADVYTGPGVAVYNRGQSYLDVVSSAGTGDNTIWFGYVATAPYSDDSFEVTFTTTSDTDLQTCPEVYDMQVLPDSKVCDGNVDCPDGADELEMCPCPQGFVECNDPSSDPCSRDSIASLCPAYNQDDIVCFYNKCGQCTAQLHDFSGRRIPDAECQGSAGGCVDDNGNPKEEGDTWPGRCGECICVSGFAMCPIAGCAAPPNPLCTVKEDPDACCPEYICPDVCIDEDGKTHVEGSEWVKDTPCEEVCRCVNGNVACPVIDCPPKPARKECTYITPDKNKETCCPQWICEDEGCVDRYGNEKAEGETWQEPCGECFCQSGNSICPAPGCEPPPSDACAVIESLTSCCPTYDCPEEGGCTDESGNLRAEGESWQGRCGQCVCTNGFESCPIPLCIGPPDPACTINEDPNACCPTYNCPGDGCADRWGNAKEERDRWQEPCGECVCLGGRTICPVSSCPPAPHPLCTAVKALDTCCPNFQCPEGCVDDNNVLHESGKEWQVNTCTTCSCPPGEGLRHNIRCVETACDAPPSPECVVGEPPKGECCPTFTCPTEGECPAVDPKSVGICGSTCGTDADCLSKQKCCPNACGSSSCVEPIPVEPVDPKSGGTQCIIPCPRIFRPVCGTDGTTHTNECEMGRAACEMDIEITVAYEGECTETTELKAHCVDYSGAQHKVGDSYLSTDGCNQCICEETTRACTEKACLPPGPCNPDPCQNGGICSVRLRRFFTCTCLDGYSGRVCDAQVCRVGRGFRAVTYQEGATVRFQEGCSLCTCTNGEIVCPEVDCPAVPVLQPTQEVYGVACNSGGDIPLGCCEPIDCTIECVGELNPCFANPCDVTTCAINPEATCLPNYCGGCDAVFFDNDGNEIDCKEPEPARSRLGPCYPNPCINGGSCSVWLLFSYQCTCSPPFRGSRCEFMDCPPDLAAVQCFANPCDVTSCDAYPDARCQSNYCGGCNAVFYDDDGLPIEQCSQEPSAGNPGQCPPMESGGGGGRFGLCANICQDDSTCGATQKCCPTACGGTSCMVAVQPQSQQGCTDQKGNSRAEGDKWTSACGECICRNGVSDCEIVCRPAPKPNCVVKKDPNACCPAYACPQDSQDDCPPGVPIVACAKDPCVISSCAVNPTARCEANFCGSCNAVYYDDNDVEIDCSATGGPTDLQQCPPVEGGGGGFGICANICQDDSACNQGQKCCPTACGGTSCVDPVQTPPTVTKCQQQVEAAGRPVPGKYIPQCTGTGEFVQIQCWGSIGRCWCVNEHGEELEGSRRERGQGVPTCVEEQQPTPNPLAGQGDDITPDQDGGVLKAIKSEGIGREVPQKGDNVSVHYVGTFLDGTQFDSSRDSGEKFEFQLGIGDVIKGWDIGIATMKRGEVSVLTLLPEYAYGDRQRGPIPPNSTLVFEVEVFDWTVPGGPRDLLQCPQLKAGGGGFGICANICQDDSACNQGQKCCPTACGGTSCVEPVQTQPTEGCTDRHGNPKANGETWSAPCGECSCINGREICPTAICAGAPHGACTIIEDPDACCPSYDCPEGCPEGDKFRQVGDTWKPSPCLSCSCERPTNTQPGETVYPVGCQSEACPQYQLSPGCTYVAPKEDQCCGSLQCLDGNSECPPESPQVYCFVSPCQYATCPADSMATCLTNYCGGCNAVFYDRNGNEIDCLATATQCQLAVEEAGEPTPGKYIPQCTGTGDFEPMQCHHSVGRCWCVNENGLERLGTSRIRGEERPVCDRIPEPVSNPGECPPTQGGGGFGMCGNLCQDDSTCGETRKCCPTACGGTSCVDPVQVQPTDLAPEPLGHPGECPAIDHSQGAQGEGLVGLCANSCADDSTCGETQKCCRTACGGLSCVEAVQVQPPRDGGECTDRDGKLRSEGEIWSDRCGDCVCTGGTTDCNSPAGQCAPPPFALCVPKVDPNSCCPSYTCPEGCLDGDTFRQAGDEWQLDSCTTCSCIKSANSQPGAVPLYPVTCDSQACPLYDLTPGCTYVPPREDQCCGTVECEPVTESECPPGVVKVACADPCLNAACPAYPAATCRVNYCGECSAAFHDGNGNEVDCTPLSANDCIDKDGNRVQHGALYRPAHACMDCQCREGQPHCPAVHCDQPENPALCTVETSPDECCPRYICQEGCTDKGPLRQFNEQYDEGCYRCTCQTNGITQCNVKPCPPFDAPTPGCTSVVIPPPPGKCCPEQLIDCPSIFLEEPVNTYVVRHSQPVTLSCGADVLREDLSFECNGQVMDTARVEYAEEIGRTTASIVITRRKVEEHTGEDKFSCQCLAVTEDQQIHRSDKAYVAISFLRKKFEQNPANIQVQLGESAQLTCEPPLGVPTPIVTWKKDGQLLDPSVPSGPYSFADDGTSLIISEIYSEQTGSYTCEAQNNASTRRTAPAIVSLN